MTRAEMIELLIANGRTDGLAERVGRLCDGGLLSEEERNMLLGKLTSGGGGIRLRTTTLTWPALWSIQS